MRNKLKQLFFEAEDCLEQGNISLGIKKYIAALNEAQKNSCEEYLALTYLGMAHGEAGDYTRAIECMKRSQEVALALYDADSVPYAVAVSNEGMIHNHRGRLKDAERFLDQAVAILRTAKRPMPPELRETMRAQTAIVYSNGADCKAKLGKASEALALMRSAYNSAKLDLPPGDSLRVQLGLELGVLLNALGHTREAHALEEESLLSLAESGLNPMQMLAPFTEAIANSSAMLEGLEPFVQPPPKNKSRSKKSKTSNVVSLFPAQSESNLPQAPQCKGYQLKITLKRVKPAIWRRITAPAQCSLAELHCVIQEAMGWHDEHLHEFLIDKRRFADCQQDPFTSDVHDFELGSFNFQVGSKFVYVYDFGDGWEHSIEVEKLLDADALEASDVFINGKGGCPPEDCGGPYGFMQLLETLKTDGPEKEELVEWLGDDYDPQQLPDCFSGKKVRSKKTVAKKAAHESRISSPASP